jgi:hypothetical protein
VAQNNRGIASKEVVGKNYLRNGYPFLILVVGGVNYSYYFMNSYFGANLLCIMVQELIKLA